MDSKTEDQINFAPLVELFGTFFEKLTNNHRHRDLLRKELTEFKCVLYTSQKDASNIDTYLNLLNIKSIIPAESSSIKPDSTATMEAKKGILNTNTKTDASPKNKPTFNYIKKVEILLISDFLKYRSVGQADKKQVLASRYSHVQSLEKNPNNFYKTLAIYLFTLMIKSSGLEKKLSDLIDEVAAKRIELSSPTESLTHDDICGAFCGFFSQLIRMKRQHQPVVKILETFHEMAGSEKAFSTGLASFVKFKIYSFIEQPNFPYELISIKAQVQSKTFREKVENNDNSQIDNVLRLIPFIFEKDVVLHIFENGKLSDVTYKVPKQKKAKEGEVVYKENDDLNTIYLLIEKVFLTVSVFGLFSVSSSPFNDRTRSPAKTTSANNVANVGIVGRPVQTESPNTIRKVAKVRTLAIDTLIANNQNPKYQAFLSTNSNSIHIANGGSLQETEYKYRTLSARLSYNPPEARTISINSATETRKLKYDNSVSENSTAAYQGADSRLKTEEAKSDAISSNAQSNSTKNSDTSANTTNAANKSYYPRSYHAKTNSFGSYNSIKSQPYSGRISLNSQQYRYAAAVDTNKMQNNYKTPSKIESSPYYQRNYFGSSTNPNSHSTKNEKNYQENQQKTITEPKENAETSNTFYLNSTQDAVGNNMTTIGAPHTNNSPSKEKLKTIVSSSPKGLIQIPAVTTTLTNNSPTYLKPSYSYSSKYAANISYNSKYQPQNLTLNTESADQSKAQNKYQINANYSYQGRTSSPVKTYRTSYIPQIDISNNSTLTNEALTHRPYTGQNPSSFRNDLLSNVSKNTNGEASQYLKSNVSENLGVQLTTLSTNSSISNNPYMLTNQTIQQTQLV